jgi:dephospho-CoA kinase
MDWTRTPAGKPVLGGPQGAGRRDICLDPSLLCPILVVMRDKVDINGSTLLAVVGLAGAGKSTAIGFLSELLPTPVIHFGGVVLAEVRRRGLAITESNERQVREQIRGEYGMGAIAHLSSEAIRTQYGPDDVALVDGLYSYEEREVLIRETGRRVQLLAIHTTMSVRTARLGNRAFRPLTPQEVFERDLWEVRALDKATPIALADYHIVNSGPKPTLRSSVERFLSEVLPMGRA